MVQHDQPSLSTGSNAITRWTPWFLSLLSMLLPALVSAQKAQVFKGTIGNDPFYMELRTSASKESVTARYFYRSTLRDAALSGTVKGDKVTLYSNKAGKDFDEKFTLSADGSGGYRGTKEDRAGAKMPVVLEAAAAEVIPHPKAGNAMVERLRREDRYNYIRTALFRFEQDSIQLYNGKSFDWFSETHSNAAFFRLGTEFSNPARNTVNPILDTMHMDLVLRQLTCTTPGPSSVGFDLVFNTTVSYLNHRLLGFQIYSPWDCSGNHPDRDRQGFLLDMENGRNYDIDDIVLFDGSGTAIGTAGLEEFRTYRRNHFGPKLLSILTLQEGFKPPVAASDCDFTDSDRWAFVSWRFTDKGIGVTPFFGPQHRACGEERMIPYQAFRRYRNPTFPFPFPD